MSSPHHAQFVLLGTTTLRIPLALGVTVIAGRALSPEGFGIFAIVAAVISLAQELTDMGTGNAALRDSAAGADEVAVLERLLMLRLTLSVIAAALCLGYAMGAAGLIRDALLATAVVIVLFFTGGCGIVFNLRQAPIGPAILGLALQVASLATIALLAASHAEPHWFIAVLLARETLAALGLYALAAAKLGRLPVPRLRSTVFASSLSVSATVAVATLAYHVQLQGGIFWVREMLGDDSLASFAAAQRLLVPLIGLPWAVMLPLLPLLAWLAAGDEHARFVRQAQAAIGLSAGISALAAASVAALAQPIVSVLYGGKFDVPPFDAATVLLWLALPYAMGFVVAALSATLIALRAERAMLGVVLAGLGINLIASPLAILAHGPAGSAIAIAVSIGATMLAGLVLVVARGVPIERRLAWTLAPAAILVLATPVLPAVPWMRIVAVGGFACVGLAFMWQLPVIVAARLDQSDIAKRMRAAHV